MGLKGSAEIKAFVLHISNPVVKPEPKVSPKHHFWSSSKHLILHAKDMSTIIKI